ncbi:MAG TPA: PilZ domain-containing protein [Polyangiaceae bacterium LLY-WYZ-15_(1-7)]|nr:hypothetical protein [Sandaracinus sp.]MBJ70654.1 hypothetical protein [Sandaracinus sp.]HJL05080.1 PilZ domain-containing protein [Polyangiaceae bacterium LLY-WYZ-15_(1-7)]HJL10579.1 PilZ domain-containing protein [Polyangiaceae bacterium LLY-WYZ-15_(1-7)]
MRRTSGSSSTRRRRGRLTATHSIRLEPARGPRAGARPGSPGPRGGARGVCSASMNGEERRRAPRFAIWFPMQIANGGEVIIGISRDVSEVGVRLVAAAAPEAGATVEVTLSLPGDEAGERTLSGTIVRVRENAADSEGLWKHEVAVAFDERVEALEPLLEEVARSSQPPPEP